MADDSNKLPDLVPDFEDDPTAELETLGGESPRQIKTGIDLLRARLNEKNLQLATLEKEARNFYDTVESGKIIIKALQLKIEQQQTTIKKLGDEKLSAEAENEETLGKLSYKASRIARLVDELSRNPEDSEKQAQDMSILQNQLAEALDDNDYLRASLDGDSKLKEYQQRLAEKEGCITGNVQKINTLIQQLKRTECYADELRTRLQDIAAVSSNELQHIQQLETSLADATSQIGKLQIQLKNETLHANELRQQNDQMRDELEQEIKRIRFELGAAEKNIANQENIGEQLASDLLDNRAYRQALELQLDSTSKDNEKAIKDLTRKLKNLERTKADIERQLENKNSAIEALLSEVATRSHTIESTGEVKRVMHEIDGRMSGRHIENPSSEKTRVTRLLIGNVDGKELRCPLFRSRLTIGRTADNDIQLKTKFISRRHAVIVTENEQTRIIDWGSTNGVYVNHSRIAEQTLQNGDIIAIGSAEFRYEERPKR